MSASLSPLETWLRPGYTFSVTGSFAAPNSVTLTSPARSLTVDAECVSRHTDRDEDYLLLDELVAEAMRQWHADTSPKQFVVKLTHLRRGIASPSITLSGQATRVGVVTVCLTAANAAEAIRGCRETHPDSDIQVATEVKEFPPPWDGSRTKVSREELLRLARENPMSQEEREAQRISFVFGNLRIDRPDLTKDDIVRAGEKMRADEGGES